MKKFTSIVMPFYLIVICQTNTLAQDNSSSSSPYFFGVKGGYQLAHDTEYNHTDPMGFIGGIYGGMQFLPLWSWDLGYQYHEKLDAKATHIDVDTSLIESALRYDWLFQEHLSLYGRLGVAYWMMKKNNEDNTNLDARGFSPLVELGITYRQSNNIHFFTGYQYVSSLGDGELGEYDSHAIVMGITYYFWSSASSKQAPINTSPPPQKIAQK